MNTVVPNCSGQVIPKEAFKKSTFCIKFTEDILLGVFCYQKTIKFRCTGNFDPETMLIVTFSKRRPVLLKQGKDGVVFTWHQNRWHEDMPKGERKSLIKWLEENLPKSRISFMPK